MSIPQPIKKSVLGVILDLDGTLLNTDGIVSEVLKVFLVKFGKQWDGREADKILGKTPFEAAAAIVEDYGLPCATEEFVSEITPTFSDQWRNIKPLPGASRLINHLKGHGIPMALASNSPRACIESKISCQQDWKESFSAIIGGDEVPAGKPSPEIFLEAANRLKMEPSSCLVIEDSLPGVTAGKAAGMEVVAVPYLPKQSHLYTSADDDYSSGFSSMAGIEGTLPLEPWHIGGLVIKGFGRGSKVLGIPTVSIHISFSAFVCLMMEMFVSNGPMSANLSTEGYTTLLSEYPSGVYFGWAGLPVRGVYKMVMSIGWNPYFNNKEKTIEPWLLHEFDEDFYGEELRLVIVGYIRPELNFPSLESLIEKIHDDRRIAEKALELPLYSKHRNDPYLEVSDRGDHKNS
ncbi:hypothetical protein CDL15_Pgr027997 [Punica granatum]|uniref:riboflavin kinase n=1 Tax=Punica granatum TaxID=22663 RepID=A0A218XKA0_PUNGR|nr:hypothetical protein CDL15_Pgr027997 [Punica granatum]